jgi:hypothetical protein
MMMKGPFRELLPVSVEATVKIPDNLKVYGVHLLVSGQEAQFKTEDNKISLSIPRILDHEIIGIDLKG